MTKKHTPFTSANEFLQAACRHLLDTAPSGTPESADAMVKAQDAILNALGALERAAYRYLPAEQVDNITGAPLFRQEIIDEVAAQAYLRLRALAAPLIDEESPAARDIARIAPLLLSFIEIDYADALAAEQ